MVAELAVRLPAGSQLAIGSRQELPLPVPRSAGPGRPRRDRGRRPGAWTQARPRSLLARRRRRARGRRDGRASSSAPRDGPPASYLAALAIEGRRLAAATIATTFTGDDRFMADYLRSEFLDRVSRADVVVPHPDVDPRPDVAVRCATSPSARSARPRARPARAPQPPGDPARPPRRVVPLPPPVPRAAARRAGPSGAGDGARAPPPRRRRGTRRTASRKRPSSTPSRPATPIGSPASCSSWPTRSGPAGGSTRSCAGWSGSRPTA